MPGRLTTLAKPRARCNKYPAKRTFVGTLFSVRAAQEGSSPVESLSFSPDARDRIRAAGATFTDEAPLTFEGLERAPNGPGVFVLVCQDPKNGARFAWSEASYDVRARLRALTSRPESLQGELRALFEQPERLRFRAARAPDPERRARLADILSSEVRRTRPEPILGFVC